MSPFDPFGYFLKERKYSDLLTEISRGGVKETLDKLASRKRFGVGISKDDSGNLELRVTLEKRNKRNLSATKFAERISKEQNVKVRTINLGRIQIVPTAQPALAMEASYLKPYELFPGSSISHQSGYAATLGVFAYPTSSTRRSDIPLLRGISDKPYDPLDKLGFVSSGHALSLWGRGSSSDVILSPGAPDAFRSLRNSIGHLYDFTILVPANEEQGSLYNEADLAFVILNHDINDEGCFGNVVPAPSDPDRTNITLKSVLNEVDLFDYINRPVFKIGRTSGLTSGSLSIVALSGIPIIGADRRDYIFTNCALVESTSADAPFSRPGDSGAVVYTENGIAIGTVVAGNDQNTIIQPLSRGLRILGLEML